MPISLGELAAALGEEHAPRLVQCDPATAIDDLTADSRAVGPGSGFIAIRGATHDGHDYLEAARERGATVCIVEHGREDGSACLGVRDTARAVALLAATVHGWPSRALDMVGVTGTNGKTTTAHLLGAVLRSAARPYLRLGTTGHWLVDREVKAEFTTPFPLELQALLAEARSRGAEAGVMEVSSHALAQARVEPIRYRAVAMTSFSQDHLDFHRTMEDYLAAKLLLCAHYLEPTGIAVAPSEASGDPGSRFLACARERGATAWSVSTQSHAAIHPRSWSATPSGLQAELETPRGPVAIRSPLVGDFNLDNLMVTTGLALALGLEPEEISIALSAATGAPGRLELVSVQGVDGPRVYVDYAHTPDAVARALAALRPTCTGDLVVLLGCGGDRDRAKRPMMARAALEGSDLFIATSDNPRTEDPRSIIDDMLAEVALEDLDHGGRLQREVDRRHAIANAVANADRQDTILIAGKGHEDYQVLGTTKVHLDDREEAAKALRARRDSFPA